MFKSLRLLCTEMVECIALPNATWTYPKLHAAIIQDIPKVKKKNPARQMQTLIPREVIQVVSH